MVEFQANIRATTLLWPIILLLCMSFSCLGELMHVHVIYRHGDRSPVKFFPTAANLSKYWPIGMGQLTPQGMAQHFELGSFLRKKYNQLLSSHYIREEIRVRSSDVDRTLMSAESDLAGLYYDEKNTPVHPGLPWQPVPIHTVPRQEDALLLKDGCPRLLQLVAILGAESIQYQKDHHTDFLKLASFTGYPEVNLTNGWSVFDVLECERSHNRPLPAWVTPELWTFIVDMNNHVWANQFRTPEMRRLSAGVILFRVVEHMQAVVESASGRRILLETGRKMVVYSGHDNDVLAVLAALGIYNDKQPHYAACIMIELHRLAKGGGVKNWMVRVLFRNSTDTKVPVALVIPGCSADCPLDRFMHLTAGMRLSPEDHEIACRIPSPSDYGFFALTPSLSMGFSVFCGLGILIVMLAIVIYLLRKRRYRKYRLMQAGLNDDD